MSVDEFVSHDGPADDTPAARAWLGRWVQASRRLLDAGAPAPGDSLAAPGSDAVERPGAFAREQLAAFRKPVTRRALVEATWRVTWPHDRLILGASRLIREADAVVPGKKISVHANRGLAGIDGTIATGIGIALASQTATMPSTADREGVAGVGAAATGITRVLLGDLAALHDVGALLFGIGERRPHIQVIVGNDGGGTIFDGLEVAATTPPVAFDRVLYTPQSIDLRALALAYGWEYRCARNRGELDEALVASDVPTIVDVPLPR